MKRFILTLILLIPHLLCAALPSVDEQIGEYARIYEAYRSRGSVARFEVHEDFDPMSSHVEALYTEKLPQLKEYYSECLAKESDPLRLQAYNHLIELAEKAHDERAFTLENWAALNLGASLVVSDPTVDPLIALFEIQESMAESYQRLAAGEVEDLSDLFQVVVDFDDDDEEEDNRLLPEEREFGFVAFIYETKGELELRHFHEAFGLQLGLVGVPSPRCNPEVHGGLVAQPLSFLVHDLAGHWSMAAENWPDHYEVLEALYERLSENPNDDELTAFFLVSHEFVPDETSVDDIFYNSRLKELFSSTVEDSEAIPEELASEESLLGRYTLAMLSSRVRNLDDYHDTRLTTYIQDLLGNIFVEVNDLLWEPEYVNRANTSEDTIVVNEDSSILAKVYRRIWLLGEPDEDGGRILTESRDVYEIELFLTAPDEYGMVVATLSSPAIEAAGHKMPRPIKQLARGTELRNYATDYAKLVGIELANPKSPTDEEAKAVFLALDKILVDFYLRHCNAM